MFLAQAGNGVSQCICFPASHTVLHVPTGQTHTGVRARPGQIHLKLSFVLQNGVRENQPGRKWKCRPDQNKQNDYYDDVRGAKLMSHQGIQYEISAEDYSGMFLQIRKK